jgi:hypothetical protein
MSPNTAAGSVTWLVGCQLTQKWQGLQDYKMKKINFVALSTHHVKWVHCHHGMGRPWVAARGDGRQIWMLAANILTKQSRTAERGWSSSLGVARGANNPPP